MRSRAGGPRARGDSGGVPLNVAEDDSDLAD